MEIKHRWIAPILLVCNIVVFVQFNGLLVLHNHVVQRYQPHIGDKLLNNIRDKWTLARGCTGKVCPLKRNECLRRLPD